MKKQIISVFILLWAVFGHQIKCLAQLPGTNFTNPLNLPIGNSPFFDLTPGKGYSNNYGTSSNDVIFTFTLAMEGIVNFDLYTKTGLPGATPTVSNPLIVYMLDANRNLISSRSLKTQYNSDFWFSWLLQPGKYYAVMEFGTTGMPFGFYNDIIYNVPLGATWQNSIDAGAFCSEFKDTKDLMTYVREDLMVDTYAQNHDIGEYSNNIFYKFTLAAASEVNMSCVNNEGQNQWIYLTDGAGNLIAKSDGSVEAPNGPLIRNLSVGTYFLVSEMVYPYYPQNDTEARRTLTTKILLNSNINFTVNAGVDKSTTGVTATLAGSTSINCSNASYTWTKQSGPTATLNASSTPTLNLTNLTPGNYVFRLTATIANVTSYDEVSLNVANPQPGNYFPSAINLPIGGSPLFDPSPGKGYSNNYGTPSNDVIFTFTLGQQGIINFDLHGNEHPGRGDVPSDSNPLIIYILDANGRLISSRSLKTEYNQEFWFSWLLQPGKYYAIMESGAKDRPFSFYCDVVYSAPLGATWQNPIILNNFNCMGLNDTKDLLTYVRNDLMVDTYGANRDIGEYSNNVFYKFTLGASSEIIISCVNKEGQNQWVYLTDEAGNFIAATEGPIIGPNGPLIRKLAAGTYYAISEMVYPYYPQYDTEARRTLNTRIGFTSAPNLIVNAGSDKIEQLPLNSLVLEGSTNYLTCAIVYSWTKQSGPNVVMSNSSTSSLKLTNITPGDYLFRLSATSSTQTAYDEIRVSVAPTPLQQDSLVLVNLYQNTGGKEKWVNNANWLSHPLSNWYGVTVSGDRITGLSLQNNKLNGTINEFNLPKLSQLDLSSNNIVSLNISQLKELRSFDVSRNRELIKLNINTDSNYYPQLVNFQTHICDKLTTLNIQGMPALETLEVWGCSLTELTTQDSTNYYHAIEYLYVNNNDLQSLNISNMPNLNSLEANFNQIKDLKVNFQPGYYSNLNSFAVNDNKLDFGDLEPISLTLSNISSALDPQDSVKLSYNLTTRTISVNVSGVNNVYQWTRNGVLVNATSSSSLTLTLTEYLANAYYQCTITNTVVMGLTLYSEVKRPQQFGEPTTVTGFRTKASGNWNDYTIWQVSKGTIFVDAQPGEVPKEVSSVYIEANHSILLTGNASCKDLHLNVKADIVRLDTKENVLEVWGKLRTYTGAAPGANNNAEAGVPGWIKTGTNGRIRLKGTTNRVITEKDEFSSHINLKGWTLECDLANGIIGTINSNFRTGNLIITSGNLEIRSQDFNISQ